LNTNWKKSTDIFTYAATEMKSYSIVAVQ